MERQHTHSSRLQSIAGTALAVLATTALFGNREWVAEQLGLFFCRTAGNALGELPCLILAACQAMQAYVVDQHGLLGWLLQTLLCFGPLLSVLWAAI
jgi:hypothetical protein